MKLSHYQDDLKYESCLLMFSEGITLNNDILLKETFIGFELHEFCDCKKLYSLYVLTDRWQLKTVWNMPSHQRFVDQLTEATTIELRRHTKVIKHNQVPIIFSLYVGYIPKTDTRVVCSAVFKSLWGQWRPCMYDAQSLMYVIPSLICCMPCFIYMPILMFIVSSFVCDVLMISSHAMSISTFCMIIHMLYTKICIIVASLFI